jgi:hypothetical protein
MIRILSVLCLALTALAEPISPRLAGDIADAIHRAEGGAKARAPYGITSRRVRDHAHAREITLAAIRQEWDRWERGGRRGTYYAHLARRWCPPQHDRVGHRNLTRNLTLIMRARSIERAATQ